MPEQVSTVRFKCSITYSKTFMRYPEYQFSRLLPIFVDDGNVLTALKRWIYEPSKETEILFIEDNPVLFSKERLT